VVLFLYPASPCTLFRRRARRRRPFPPFSCRGRLPEVNSALLVVFPPRCVHSISPRCVVYLEAASSLSVPRHDSGRNPSGEGGTAFRTHSLFSAKSVSFLGRSGSFSARVDKWTLFPALITVRPECRLFANPPVRNAVRFFAKDSPISAK